MVVIAADRTVAILATITTAIIVTRTQSATLADSLEQAVG
jgi:hypothetical protein